ncbi:uncharacterized protein [Procambarus clarkii]|uniref:uncharacterized protein n=1 Tax=Procambarus clarkii TaxID=6728 RepID=UPI003742BB45
MFHGGDSPVSLRGTPATLVMLLVTMTGPAAGNIIGFAIPDMVQYGSCADAQTIERLDFQNFTGVWYQVADVPNSYVEVTQCSRSVYSWDGRQFNVISEGWDDFGDQIDQITSISQVQPANPDQPHPYLQIRSPNVPPVPYNIINTDYLSFACVYSCFEFLGVKVEIYSILSRTSKVTNASLAACHVSLEALGVDVANLQPVPQGDECWYNDPKQLLAVESSRVTESQTSQSDVAQIRPHHHHHHHHHHPAVSTLPTTRTKIGSESSEGMEPHINHGEAPKTEPHHHHHHHHPAVSTQPSTRAKTVSLDREVMESQTNHAEAQGTGPHHHHHHHHHLAVSTLPSTTVRTPEDVTPAASDPDENLIEDIDEILSLMVEDVDNVEETHSHHEAVSPPEKISQAGEDARKAFGGIRTGKGNAAIRPLKSNISLQGTTTVEAEKRGSECNIKTRSGCSDSSTRGQAHEPGLRAQSLPKPTTRLCTSMTDVKEKTESGEEPEDPDSCDGHSAAAAQTYSAWMLIISSSLALWAR